MLHQDCTFEDTRIVVSRTYDETGAGWRGQIYDLPTGNALTIAWTDEQLGAVIALANGLGEEYPFHPITVKLYEIAEPLFEGVDPIFRLIP